MKLMKLMFAGILVLSFAFAQDDNPCDPNMTYEVADPGPDGGCGDYADCNGNGAFDLGEPCFEQPPFDDVDANGDGKIDLVYSSIEKNTITWLENKGGGISQLFIFLSF